MDNPNNILITTNEIEDILNYFGNIGDDGARLSINDKYYYQKAFTHESYYQSVRTFVNSRSEDTKCFINFAPSESSERLEYLGDHVLKAIMGRYLYQRYPNEREGFLTDLKIKIEKCSMLHQIAVTLGFKKHLLLSSSIENQTIFAIDKGRNTLNYYEDAFESFIGAISEDFGERGYIYAERFTRNVIENVVDFAELNSTNDNYKDTLVKTFVFLKWPKPTKEKKRHLDETSVLYMKTFPKILPIERKLLNQSQILCLEDYTSKVISQYPELSKYATNGDLIAGLGFGRKNIQSEQECSRQVLLNLGLSFCLKENTSNV